LKHSAAKLFPSGTLLMAMYGATVGKTAILNIEAATNQAVCAIFPRADQARTDYLRYALVHQRPEILKLRYGGAQPNISQQVVRNLVVRVPPIAEQRKIAEVLGLAQRALEQQERLTALSIELKKALLQYVFTHGLRGEPQKQTEIGPVPQSWEVRQFGEVAAFKNGINFTSAQKGDNGILTVDVLNMYGDGTAVVLDKVYRVCKPINQDYHLKNGDLLFVRSSVKLEGVGWTCMFSPVREPVTFCGFVIRARLFNPTATRPTFLTHYFRTDRARRTLISGGAKVAITNINQGLLQNILFPCPSPEEQDEIADAIDKIDRKIALHKAKYIVVTDLFHTLLHQLISGQVRVHKLRFPEFSDAMAN
jgi:type I restriction enzyme S subunit